MEEEETKKMCKIGLTFKPFCYIVVIAIGVYGAMKLI